MATKSPPHAVEPLVLYISTYKYLCDVRNGFWSAPMLWRHTACIIVKSLDICNHISKWKIVPKVYYVSSEAKQIVAHS